jgi:hypothetical protein
MAAEELLLHVVYVWFCTKWIGEDFGEGIARHLDQSGSVPDMYIV